MVDDVDDIEVLGGRAGPKQALDEPVVLFEGIKDLHDELASKLSRAQRRPRLTSVSVGVERLEAERLADGVPDGFASTQPQPPGSAPDMT